ncbi:MAG: peroxiredoxin family protein [Candidatus Saccharimonadaceae bacterium]
MKGRECYYEKTDREKFEIVGVVGDSPLDALMKIIETDSITWSQILSKDSNKIKEEYGIKGYPTTFLIDPEGVIIAKDLRGLELEMKVMKLVKE